MDLAVTETMRHPIKLGKCSEGTKSFAITCYDQMRLQEQVGGIG
jgi:hypothetical protein